MKIESEHIDLDYRDREKNHSSAFNFLSDKLESKGNNVEHLLTKLIDFQIAIPSWALGTGGTRFGRFPGGGEPRSLEEKITDVGLLLLHRSFPGVEVQQSRCRFGLGFRDKGGYMR